jgi:transcription elongation factor Elf1
MAHYTRRWDCQKCGKAQESIDTPQFYLCERCDDITRVRCTICGQPTTITPAVLRANRARGATHGSCGVVDDP